MERTAAASHRAQVGTRRKSASSPEVVGVITWQRVVATNVERARLARTPRRRASLSINTGYRRISYNSQSEGIAKFSIFSSDAVSSNVYGN